MANEKTAELLMGADNPNRPDEIQVRVQLIKQLQQHRQELEDENAELRCASRLLNDRLVKQASAIACERERRQELESLVRRARMILSGSHVKRNPSHAKHFEDFDTVSRTINCSACVVLIEMERGVR